MARHDCPLGCGRTFSSENGRDWHTRAAWCVPAGPVVAPGPAIIPESAAGASAAEYAAGMMADAAAVMADPSALVYGAELAADAAVSLRASAESTAAESAPRPGSHVYEPCEHPGRHGYGDDWQFCDRCRQGIGARVHVTAPAPEPIAPVEPSAVGPAESGPSGRSWHVTAYGSWADRDAGILAFDQHYTERGAAMAQRDALNYPIVSVVEDAAPVGPESGPESVGDTRSRRDDAGEPDQHGPALAHDYGDPCACSECIGPAPVPPADQPVAFTESESESAAPVLAAPVVSAPAVRARAVKLPAIGTGKHSRCVAHIAVDRADVLSVAKDHGPMPHVGYACFDSQPSADTIADRRAFVAEIDASMVSRHVAHLARLGPEVSAAAIEAMSRPGPDYRGVLVRDRAVRERLAATAAGMRPSEGASYTLAAA